MFSALARKYSRFFLKPLAKFISATGISPNAITVIGFFLMIGVAVVLARGYLSWGGLLIIAVALFDAMDGTLARLAARTSRFGAFLDSTLDRFSEAVIYLGLFIYFLRQDDTLGLRSSWAILCRTNDDCGPWPAVQVE